MVANSGMSVRRRVVFVSVLVSVLVLALLFSRCCCVRVWIRDRLSAAIRVRVRVRIRDRLSAAIRD